MLLTVSQLELLIQCDQIKAPGEMHHVTAASRLTKLHYDFLKNNIHILWKKPGMQKLLEDDKKL